MSSGVVVQYHEHNMVALGESRRGIVHQCDHVNLDGIPCGYVDTPNGFGPNRAGSHTTSTTAVEQFWQEKIRDKIMSEMLAAQSTGTDPK